VIFFLESCRAEPSRAGESIWNWTKLQTYCAFIRRVRDRRAWLFTMSVAHCAVIVRGLDQRAIQLAGQYSILHSLVLALAG